MTNQMLAHIGASSAGKKAPVRASGDLLSFRCLEKLEVALKMLTAEFVRLKEQIFHTDGFR